MKHPIQDIEYAEYLFDKFYSIGSTENGGVTRLGYTEVEDEMHEVFIALGKEQGFESYVDEVGNTYIYNPACKSDEDGEYYLVASHLDSVGGTAWSKTPEIRDESFDPSTDPEYYTACYAEA